MVEFFLGESQGVRVSFNSQDGKDLSQSLSKNLPNCINKYAVAMKNPSKFKFNLNFDDLPDRDGFFKSQFGLCYLHLVELEIIDWINDLYIILIANPNMPECFCSPDMMILEEDEDSWYIENACIAVNLAKLRSFDSILLGIRHEFTHLKQMLEDKNSGTDRNTDGMNYYDDSQLLGLGGNADLKTALHYMNMYLSKMEREAYLSDADFDVNSLRSEYNRLIKSGRNSRSVSKNLVSNHIKSNDLLQDNFIRVISDGIKELKRHSDEEVPRSFIERMNKKYHLNPRRSFLQEFSRFAEKTLQKFKSQRDKWFYNKVHDLEYDE